MKTRVLVQVVATIVVGVFALGIWLTGGHLDSTWLRFFSVAVSVAVAALWLWDRVVWKLSIIQWLGIVPLDISGTWKGTFESLWEDGEAKQTVAPKLTFLVVRQTASSVSVIQLTAESKSCSSVGAVSGKDGMRSLDYIYLNQPDMKVEQRSRMHRGSASLEITGRPATRLCGRYWTDRDTKGQLDFRTRKQRSADDFDEATKLFSS